MARQPADLSEHINLDVQEGNPAEFPITLKPLFTEAEGLFQEIPKRFAVVRTDNGQALSIVSDRYSLVPHDQLLGAVHKATENLDVGPVPRGIYVDRGGARMRAVYKFPALAQSVARDDTICPCIKLENTYDGTSRITAHIGAFRFVCTNLAVGGGGVFAGGFMSVHAGEIPVNQLAEQLGSYLTGFDRIVATYRQWNELPLDRDRYAAALEHLPVRSRERIAARAVDASTVFAGYNAATFPRHARDAQCPLRLRSPDPDQRSVPAALPAQLNARTTKPTGIFPVGSLCSLPAQPCSAEHGFTSPQSHCWWLKRPPEGLVSEDQGTTEYPSG